MRIERCNNGFFIETINGTWIFKTLDEVFTFMADIWKDLLSSESTTKDESE